MKERIYSIPLTDALNEGCGCILCTLEKKLEQDAVTYFLGPSLMEPDNREITNDKGFCPRHMKMLVEGNHRLGLALILETHVKEFSKKMELKKNTGVFAKGIDTRSSAQAILKSVKSCALCDKLNSNLRDAAGNLAYLWNAEPDFKKKFEESGELCAEHMALVLSVCEKELSGKKRDEFASTLISMQKKILDTLYEDLHSFTLAFDYRSSGKPDEKATSSIPRAVEYLTKFE